MQHAMMMIKRRIEEEGDVVVIAGQGRGQGEGRTNTTLSSKLSPYLKFSTLEMQMVGLDTR